MKPIGLAVLLLVAASSPGTASSTAQAVPAFRFENKPENLQAFMELFHRTVHVDKSPKAGAALFRSLVPDQARLKRALRDGAPPEVMDRILSVFTAIVAMKDEEVVQLARPEQTVVRVRGASTEQIAEYRMGSVAFEEFPNGAQQIAQHWLRPGAMFYQVRFLKPGDERGTTYHLFFWDGRRWAMLGPAWRGVR